METEKMIFKARVRKLGEERKIIEVPKAVRDNFTSGKVYKFLVGEND